MDFMQRMREPIRKSGGYFVVLSFLLLCETAASLILPQISSKYIDNIEMKENVWLAICALGYCLVVLLQGVIRIGNTYMSEKLGWKLCDCLRVDLFRKIYSFSVQRHKTAQEGDFLERIEGDISLLLGFFSVMAIDIINSTLMVIGILIVFYLKYELLGGIFTVLTVLILTMFLKSQNAVACLWGVVREKETDVLDEFAQDTAAYKEIIGAGKKEYVKTRFENKCALFEKAYTTASFWGNLPSTVFFSLLNIGEGIALITGIMVLGQGRMTIGEIYLILSYVGLLNMPFFILKYEFAQMPKVLAALRRINEIYRHTEEVQMNGQEIPSDDTSVVFEDVSFGYHPDNLVLRNITLQVESGEHVFLEGRTGSGKSTVLQLTAGFYQPQKGIIKIGGRQISDYRKEDFRQFIYYILQNNPILNDTLRNNLTRYEKNYTEMEIRDALAKVHLTEWLDSKKSGLEEILHPENISKDESQLLAWAGAILRSPGILLVDEFDAVISDETVGIIDEIIEKVLTHTTVLMVTHHKRSRIKIHREIRLDHGKIVENHRGEWNEYKKSEDL